MQKVTSSDVAARAGVSRTTVSYVLNRSERVNISEETRQRVLAAVDELGYIPNAAAQMLVSQRSNGVGLVYPRSHPHLSTHIFLLSAIEGLKSVFDQYGMHLLLDAVDNNSEDAYIDLLTARRIDGLILIDVPLNSFISQRLIRNAFPVVTFGYQYPQLSSIDAENWLGAKTAVEHLLDLGHRCIACITNSPHFPGDPNLRLQGYHDALQQRGVPANPDWVVEGCYTPESGYTAMNTLLDLAELPTAVFVGSDVVAFGAMTAVHERGLSIPRNIAFVGFDDVPLARYAVPPLTTVRMPAVEMGIRAGMLLMERIFDGAGPTHITLPTELIVRSSSGAA